MGEAARIYTPANVKELRYIIRRQYPDKVCDLSPEQTAQDFLAFHNLVTGKKIDIKLSDYKTQKLGEEAIREYYQLLAEEYIKEKLSQKTT